MAAFDALMRERRVLAVVVPTVRKGNFLVRALGWWLGRELRGRARRAGLPLIRFREQAVPAADLHCVAAFPFLLNPDDARLGAINAHPSLLPRHRGADPVFWTYFHDERETGVTVHWLTQGVDDGDVVLQERIPIERGTPRRELEVALGMLAGRLLARAIDQLERGAATRTPQDESQATLDPLPARGTWAIDYETWSAERLWHFLRGVREARSFVTAAHEKRPGVVEGSRLYTRDGWVELEQPTLRRRLARAILRTGSR